MPRISKTVQQLFGGISRQLPGVRFDSQLTDALNVEDSPIHGLRRRPGIERVASLASASVSNSYKDHFVNRDASERYNMQFTGVNATPLKVSDLSGTNYFVKITGNADDYLTTTTPRSDIRAVSVADTTFVSNAAKTPAMTAVMEPAGPGANLRYSPRVAFITLLSRIEATEEYLIDIQLAGGTPISVLAVAMGSGGTITEAAADVVTAINTAGFIDNVAPTPDVTMWTASLVGTSEGSTTIRIESGLQSDGGPYDIFWDFTVSANSTQGPTYIKAVTGAVDKRSDLPASAEAGDKLKIIALDSPGRNDYYVTFDTELNAWVETHQDGIETAFSTDTMPHTVTRRVDDVSGTVTGTPSAIYFEVAAAPWESRQVGDEDSAPTPSFVSHGSIDGLFVHKNRLGFLSGPYVCLSRSNDLYNFWPTTATEVLDDDPIDLLLPSSAVNKLLWGVPFDEALVLISDGKQFVLHSGADPLTVKTVNIKETTQYAVVADVEPAFAGNTLFFLTRANGYSQLREYFLESDGVSDEAPDASAHVSGLISSSVRQLVSIPEHDTLVLLYDYADASGDDGLFYRYRWHGTTKVQGSFTRFRTSALNVYSACTVDGYVYLFGAAPDASLHIGRLPLATSNTPGQDFPVHLDMWYRASAGTNEAVVALPSPVATLEKWNIPYPFNPTTIVASLRCVAYGQSYKSQSVTGSGYAYYAGPIAIQDAASPSWTSIVSAGNVTSNGGSEVVNTAALTNVIMGITFDSSVTLNEWWLKRGAGAEAEMLPDATLVHSDLLLTCNDTVSVKVSYTPNGRSSATDLYHPLTSLTAADPQPSDFDRLFLVRGKALGMSITLSSVEHFPFTIQSVTLRGSFYGHNLSYV